jgi:hypothetical protein
LTLEENLPFEMFWTWILRFKEVLGVDRAIAYTVLSRILVILGNLVTVLLMVRFLSPVEQGYYFTLLSLVALQVVFELGFSFVILQLAAHERAHLVLYPDGRVEGDQSAHSRLASVLQLTVKWYSRAAVLLASILIPSGIFFFERNEQRNGTVHWLYPWLLAALACVAIFLQDPICSFLEGCGEVRQVAGLRVCQAIGNAAFAWSAMLSHHGLFAPGATMVGSGVIGGIFIWRRRSFLFGLLHYPASENAVSWRHEILPFQWRIAVSWLCAYFTRQIFTPILFHYRGPVEAGQMGMSISVVGYFSAIILAWMTTKAPTFGGFVARREFRELDLLFKRTLWQAMSFLLVISCASWVAVQVLFYAFPKLAARIVSPFDFALLLIGTAGSVLAQSLAIYMRSFKREPFLWQSVGVAALTLLMCRIMAPGMGNVGIALSYLVCTGILGAASAWLIFYFWRQTITRTLFRSSALEKTSE